METAWTIPENYQNLLRILSWAVAALGALWLVTAVLGYMHRRAYNLTHAESGRSEAIKPDFLEVDKAKRDAAMQRGAAYDKVLDQRESGAPPAPTAQVAKWSGIAAKMVAITGVLTGIITAASRARGFQEGVDTLSSGEKLMTIVREYPVGATIAFLVLATTIYQFAMDWKKKK